MIEKCIADYETFKLQYKSIVEVIEENEVKISFADFISICGRLAVSLGE